MQGACGHHANACQRSYAWWWKPGLITLVYLHCCDYLLFRVCFHSIVNVWWWEEAQPKNLQVNFISSRLPQSEFSPKPCRRCILLSAHFAETTSPIVFWFFRQYHVANVFWWRFWTWRPCRRTIIWRCIVDFFVSYLICMFQDSVPAGSLKWSILVQCMWVRCVCAPVFLDCLFSATGGWIEPTNSGSGVSILEQNKDSKQLWMGAWTNKCWLRLDIYAQTIQLKSCSVHS